MTHLAALTTAIAELRAGHHAAQAAAARTTATHLRAASRPPNGAPAAPAARRQLGTPADVATLDYPGGTGITGSQPGPRRTAPAPKPTPTRPDHRQQPRHRR